MPFGFRPPGSASRSSRSWSSGSPPTPRCSPARSRSCNTRWSSSFARRQSNVITLAAFEEAGGLAGAIGRRAEAIYVDFDEQRREATRRVFLRLVNVSEDRDDTRRRVRRTELEQSGIGADDLQAVLDEYGRHRLLTFDRDPTSRTPTVEVAHESLLTEWERFAGWVDDAREDLLTRRRLESAAHDWVSSGSDPSFLYRGGRLELAESWATSSGFELTDDEHRFLATSREKVDRDQVVRTRRRRIVVGLLAAALVVATVAAGVAFVQRSKRRTPGEPGRPVRPPASGRAPAPSPRPAASARKHWWRTTTTRRCSWQWKGDTSKTRRRQGRTCSPRSSAAPTPLPSSGARPRPSSTSDSRRTARRWWRADRGPGHREHVRRHDTRAGSLDHRTANQVSARSVPTAASR